MKFASLLSLATLIATPMVSGAATTHWDYTEMDFWGEVSQSFSACETGVRQSPIDINDQALKSSNPASGYVSSGNGNEVSTVQATPCPGNAKCGTIKNNGHTIQVDLNQDYPVKSTYKGKEFTLLQFHFHTPSEHHIMGDFSPLEVHFVHKYDDTSYMVIGIMFQFNGNVNSTFLEQVKTLVSHSTQRSVLTYDVEPERSKS